MKKIIKYISSLFFIFLLFPMSVFAEEIITATCEVTGSDEIGLFLISNDGGSQYVDFFEENAEVTLSKDKVLMRLESSGLMVIDFKNGDWFFAGEKVGVCEFSNLEVLTKENTVDSNANSGEIIQLLESMKKQLDKIESKLDVLNAQ